MPRSRQKAVPSKPRLLSVRFGALLVLGGLVGGAAAAQSPREVLDSVRQLTTADAVHDEGLIEIGGIRQWVSVRGRHRENPVLLFLHGGPGFTVSPVSYHYMRDWEEYFTVVHWDQRGAGKTFAANAPERMRPGMTVDAMVRDAEEVVSHLRRTYGQDRIVLMAHSFGTILGVKLAERHPDWFHAYVGMGQIVDVRRSEEMGYEATLAAARAAGDEAAVEDLLAIAPFPDPDPERTVQNLGVERRWLAAYGGYYRAGGVGHNAEIASLSPDYDADELRVRDEAQGFSIDAMWAELADVDLTGVTSLDLPVVVFQGRHDLGTSSALVGEWFADVDAPTKRLVWFDDSAHMVYEEEPGKVLVNLVNVVRPLARGRAPRAR